MSAWVANGAMFALVLAVTMAEAVGLIVWHRRTGRGLSAGAVVAMLAAGAFLLAAAALALAGAAWGWVCTCLAAGGVAHLFDLRRRLSADAATRMR